jgi:SAM-dependent methyltransferase
LDSTSIHRFNGDRHLGPAGKAAYFLCNWLNNRFPSRVGDPRLSVRDFVCADLEARWTGLGRGSSPSRTLSDLFWQTRPWTQIHERLGGIRVLDVGCGSGEYGPRLIDWSGGRVSSYTGVDLKRHPRWPELEGADARLRFVESPAAAIAGSIPAGTNFIMSQSTIEHLDGDLDFFRRVAVHASGLERPSMHVHLCPSAACLGLYLFHGVRQYTPRTLSRISRLFERAVVTVYRLGGRHCNRLHFEFITWPRLVHGQDLRETRPDDYERRRRQAIVADMGSPQRSPAFYALVIETEPA